MKRYYTTKITRKGQITLPAELRREMNLAVGDAISVIADNDTGRVEIEPAANWVTRTAGMLKGKGPALSPEELDDVITNSWAEAAVERDRRVLRELKGRK